MGFTKALEAADVKLIIAGLQTAYRTNLGNVIQTLLKRAGYHSDKAKAKSESIES